MAAMTQLWGEYDGIAYQIRENPASRGTEASAEVLIGPPGQMVLNAGQQQWYEGGHPLSLLTPMQPFYVQHCLPN